MIQVTIPYTKCLGAGRFFLFCFCFSPNFRIPAYEWWGILRIFNHEIHLYLILFTHSLNIILYTTFSDLRHETKFHGMEYSPCGIVSVLKVLALRYFGVWRVILGMFTCIVLGLLLKQTSYCGRPSWERPLSGDFIWLMWSVYVVLWGPSASDFHFNSLRKSVTNIVKIQLENKTFKFLRNNDFTLRAMR